MRHKLRKLSLAALGILLAAFALLILTANKSAPLPPLPNPNGYDDFVKAGEMLDGDLPGWQELRDMREEELRTAFATTALSKHGEALALAREGLGRACRVPLDYSATIGSPSSRTLRKQARSTRLHGPGQTGRNGESRR